jgi:hypothetical protein
VLEVASLVLIAALGRSPPPKPHAPDEVRTFSYDFAQPQRLEVGGTGPTRVSVLNQLPMPVWGYGILQVGIDNSTGPSQTVRLDYVSNSGSGTRSVQRSVEVRAGERLQVSMPVPNALRYGKLSVRASGVVEGTEPGVYFTYAYRPQRVLLAIGGAEEFEKLAGQRPVNTDPAALVTALAPSDAPTELAGYVGYDAVAVASGPLESLPAGVQRALEAYAATGGVLVLGEVGRGTEAVLPMLEKEAEASPLEPYGFGYVARGGEQLPATFNLSAPVVKPQGVRPSYQRRGFGSGATADDVLLPQALAPLGRFLFIIVLFTLAIGPGSWWVARKRGPGALLVTIPGTAFVTCALIIGYSLVRDGFTVHASVHGYTLLDSARNRAITSGVGAFYANLAPGKAVFPGSTAVIAPWENSGDLQASGMTWGEGAKFGSDFLPSRSYREWAMLGVEPSRARLVVKEDGDGIKVQNALGARISSARLSWKGKDWDVTDLRDGGEARAKPAQAMMPELEHRALNRFDRNGTSRVRGDLHEGEFVALLQGPAFTPLGGLSLSHHESAHVVRGTVHK